MVDAYEEYRGRHFIYRFESCPDYKQFKINKNEISKISK